MCGVEHAVAVSSGTAALHLAVLALGIERGRRGAGPRVHVPGDRERGRARRCAPRAGRCRPEDHEPRSGSRYDAVTPRTRAVLAVHLFGRPLDWEELQNAVPPDVHLVEDAAGALGARWRGMPCGGLGELGCLSFHPRKIVSTGEGGAVTTNVAGTPTPPPAAEPRNLDRRRLRHRPSPVSTTGSRTCSARSGSSSSAVSTSCGRPGTASRRPTASGSSRSSRRRRRPRATGTAGRPTSSSSTAATGRSRRCTSAGSRPRLGRTPSTG